MTSEKTRGVTSKQFRALLDLMMCSDPWPVVGDDGEPRGLDEIRKLLNEEAASRGFPSWIVAYNEFDPEVSGADGLLVMSQVAAPLVKSVTDESSNVRVARYMVSDKTLEAEFASGATYRYYDVPAGVWSAIESRGARSLGKVFAEKIKGRYRYARVGT